MPAEGSPAEAVAQIGARLKPVVRDAARIKRLLNDPDSDEFATRESAMKELAERGEEAESMLRQALTDRPPLEARRRVEGVLAQIEERAAGPTGLQRLRAVEVLEHAGTPEARQLLERLANGEESARLTRAEKSAVDRLARRPAATP